jgi:hypothetical protein
MRIIRKSQLFHLATVTTTFASQLSSALHLSSNHGSLGAVCIGAWHINCNVVTGWAFVQPPSPWFTVPRHWHRTNYNRRRGELTTKHETRTRVLSLLHLQCPFLFCVTVRRKKPDSVTSFSCHFICPGHKYSP